MNDLMLNSTTMTMSSLDIAELVESRNVRGLTLHIVVDHAASLGFDELCAWQYAENRRRINQELEKNEVRHD